MLLINNNIAEINKTRPNCFLFESPASAIDNLGADALTQT